jgi:hypothetical protein
MNWATPLGATDSSTDMARALALDPGHELARLYLGQATASRAAET